MLARPAADHSSALLKQARAAPALVQALQSTPCDTSSLGPPQARWL